MRDDAAEINFQCSPPSLHEHRVQRVEYGLGRQLRQCLGIGLRELPSQLCSSYEDDEGRKINSDTSWRDTDEAENESI